MLACKNFGAWQSVLPNLGHYDQRVQSYSFLNRIVFFETKTSVARTLGRNRSNCFTASLLSVVGLTTCVDGC